MAEADQAFLRARKFMIEMRGCFSLFVVLAVLSFTFTAAQSAQENVVYNGGFESIQQSFPLGWAIDAHTLGKGTVIVEKDRVYSEKNSLKLVPNDNNRVPEKPFGLTQRINSAHLKGRKILIKASMLVDGGAEATVVVFDMNKDDGINNFVVLSSIAKDNFQTYDQDMTLNTQNDYLLVGCVTSSRKGFVLFDEISITAQ